MDRLDVSIMLRTIDFQASSHRLLLALPGLGCRGAALGFDFRMGSRVGLL